MNSIELYTQEIDDVEEAAEDLLSQMEGFQLLKSSLAIVFVEEETEYSELYRVLSPKLNCPVIGCTAMAMFSGKAGYCAVGISVLILTADDCEFSVGMTAELNSDNYQDEITKTYGELRTNLDTDPKLVITYGGMIMDETHAPADALVDVIGSLGNGVPVYGALASDGFTFSGFRIFCNDQVTKNGQVMALVSGNIAPRFVSVNSIGNRASFSYAVTQSVRNQVMRVGNMSFIEALQREDMAVEKVNVIGDYILSPFLVTLHLEQGDSVDVGRVLSVLNQETGAGYFLGAVPEGAILNVGIITRQEVQKTVEAAFDRILKEIDVSGSPYHTLLCNSCATRFLALASNPTGETDAYKDRLPEGFSLLGFYTYGEICPMRGNKSGKDYNFFHNYTFTVMVI